MKLQVINGSGMPVKYATGGSAGIDLTAGWVTYIDQNGRELRSTGLSVAIPEGYVGLVVPRSSLHKRGWGLANGVGVIDSDYRGPIMLVLERTGISEFINDCDYIAQLVIIPCPRFEIEEVLKLPDTSRGRGGFGSTDRTSAAVDEVLRDNAQLLGALTDER